MSDMEGMRSESWGSSVAAWEAMRGFELDRVPAL